MYHTFPDIRRVRLFCLDEYSLGHTWDVVMGLEDNAKRFIYQKLKEVIIKPKMDEAVAIARAIRVLFPKESELAICDLIFDVCRDRCRDKKAETIIRDFNYLINECYRFEILTSQRGGELYRLGTWISKKDPRKARAYVEFYLFAGDRHEDVYDAKWRKQAERLLK